MNIILPLGLLISLVVGATIGLFEAPDSIHYVILGQYLLTGKVIPSGPFNYFSPSTLFGPVYGLITAPLMSLPWPWGITLIPALQLILVIVSSILLYRIAATFLPKRVALASSMLFIFFPFQIVYATYLLSETLTQFMVTVYMFTLLRLKRSKWATTDTLVCIAAVLTLTRYVFVVLLLYSIVFMVYVRFYKRSAASSTRILFFIGVSLIGAWMLFNFKAYGKLQLTSHTGRHIYDNVVVLGKLLPASIPPDTQLFFTRIPSGYIFRPWWENQLYFPDIAETVVDRMFLTLSLSAVRSHPLSWLATIMYAFIHTPLASPYQDAPYRSQHILEILSACPQAARMTWNSHILFPPFYNCTVNRLWNMLLSAQIGLYPNVAYIFLVLAGIGATAAFQKGGVLRQFVIIFFLIHLTQSAGEWVEGRFLVPLYPLYVLFITLGVWTLYRIVSNSKNLL